jgi:hypothetical protein
MPTREMLAVRRVNIRIGNLSRHSVSRIDFFGTSLVLRFQIRGNGGNGFGLRLDGLLGFSDYGVVSRPLTAGIVWNPVADFGRRLAVRARRDPQGLVELRLDFEDTSGLAIRFNAECDGGFILEVLLNFTARAVSAQAGCLLCATETFLHGRL